RRRRETHGEAMLLRAQDIDGEAPGTAEAVEAGGLPVEAEQDQRRLQRNRGEGVNGDAPVASGGGARGHHRDAGRKAAQDAPKGKGIKRHRTSTSSAGRGAGGRILMRAGAQKPPKTNCFRLLVGRTK